VQGAQTQKSLVRLATPAFNVGLQFSTSHEMDLRSLVDESLYINLLASCSSFFVLARAF
jgi:hypothetical protein